MPNKPSFSDLAYRNKKKVTRRQLFLEKMEEILPWKLLLEPILGKYPKARKGRPPFPADVMLRIYLMRQWYGLSDLAMEESLYDIEPMRRFAHVSMRKIPDEATIRRFRHFVRRHRMTAELLRLTRQCLSERGLTVSRGRITEVGLRRVKRKANAGKSTLL
ncbi:MAG: transposase [Candidatus Dadabacteria bacterium]|nr:transposase [Candidatus Dadabacteria bacterium]MCY4263199.1 transposase [Candidatus Dadabacteria bacterium]